MAATQADYEPLYLAGIVLFNQREFFDAHEVLEDLWNQCPNEDRRFYQAVLQAAVALHHFTSGNLRGAIKLFKSGKAYMDVYPNPHHGLNREEFWAQMATCMAEIFREDQDLLRRDLKPDPELIPIITLDPPPPDWPDPQQFLHDDDDHE